MNLYAFHLGQIISTVLGQVDHGNQQGTETLPKLESGTKCPKPATPKHDAFAMVLSAE